MEAYRTQIISSQREYANLEFSAFRQVWVPIRRVREHLFDEFESLTIHKDLTLSCFSLNFPLRSNYDLDRHFSASGRIDEDMFDLVDLDSLEGEVRHKAEQSMCAFSKARAKRQRKVKRLQRSLLAYQHRKDTAQKVHHYARKGGTVVEILYNLLNDLDEELSS